MDKKQKAKEFTPFDALKGFNEELKARRENLNKTERKEIDEETAKRLNEVICSLTKGDEVFFTIYKDGRYIETEGKVNYVDFAVKTIVLSGKNYNFNSLYDIRLK